MSKYKQRSNELELMDGPIGDKKVLFKNLHELEFINQLTGGPHIGFSGIKHMLRNTKHEVHIVDIGFGAGDMLSYIIKHKHQLSCKVKLTGVDMMPETLEYVQLFHPELLQYVDIEICDYQTWFKKGNSADIVTANLFCHHLTDEQLVDFFATIKNRARMGAVINDLHRHPIAYYGIKIPTQLFSKSTFTKNDAPLSVLRGFTKNELLHVLQASGLTHYQIEWKWAFRYLISIFT